MPTGLLVQLGLLLQLEFLPQLMFLHDVGCLLIPEEPRLQLSAILVHIRLLVQLGLPIQVGLRYQKSSY